MKSKKAQTRVSGTLDPLLDKIRSLCLQGMQTDGAHHKQWVLAEILREVAPGTFETLQRTGHNMGMSP